ncbi:MAG: DUF1570 domain-containing protein [Planctomycetaceae bacterium]
MVAFGFILTAGCQLTPRTTFSADKPSQHSFTTRYFVIKSDSPIEADDPILTELNTLHTQINKTLQLPPQRDPVVLYLFSDESTYRYYMQSTWSQLPPRRAYFVGTNRELAVYSYRSPRMMEDLRHEFTHGVLHASLQTVPLWLDEGLAEYFEVEGTTPGGIHADHVAQLTSRYRATAAEADRPWSPNLFQLELKHDFQKLTRQDYAEAWAWVHFLLHSSPETKAVLVDYLASLANSSTAPRLMPLVEKSIPSYFDALRRHVANGGISPSMLAADTAEFVSPAGFQQETSESQSSEMTTKSPEPALDSETETRTADTAPPDTAPPDDPALESAATPDTTVTPAASETPDTPSASPSESNTAAVQPPNPA